MEAREAEAPAASPGREQDGVSPGAARCRARIRSVRHGWSECADSGEEDSEAPPAPGFPESSSVFAPLVTGGRNKANRVPVSELRFAF